VLSDLTYKRCWRRLRSHPGDYELCPVCFWEDDGTQLPWPMSSNGANGVSLMEAQGSHQGLGAVDKVFRREVRRPRRDKPLDPRMAAVRPSNGLD